MLPPPPCTAARTRSKCTAILGRCGGPRRAGVAARWPCSAHPGPVRCAGGRPSISPPPGDSRHPAPPPRIETPSTSLHRCRVGPERLLAFRTMGFSGPPSELDVRLSPHPALHVLMPLECLTRASGSARPGNDIARWRYRPLVQLRLHREYPRLGLDQAGPRSAGIHQRPPRRASALRAHWTPLPCTRQVALSFNRPAATGRWRWPPTAARFKGASWRSISATHSRSAPAALKSRSTRSGATRTARWSLVVVFVERRRRGPIDPRAAHQAPDALRADPLAAGLQLGVDARPPVHHAVGAPDRLDPLL